jgi:F0F1-type ATP synthase delta subunit
MKKDTKIADVIAGVVVDYLTKKKALDLIPTVIDSLKKVSSQYCAYIYVPRELSNKEKEKAKKLIANLTGGEANVFSFKVDTSLLDGMKIIYNDRVWDYSLSGQIRNI